MYCEAGNFKANFLYKAGSYFNFPENNCCVCGSGQVPINTPPSSTFGCTHTIENSVSLPIIEYCNYTGLTKT